MLTTYNYKFNSTAIPPLYCLLLSIWSICAPAQSSDSIEENHIYIYKMESTEVLEFVTELNYSIVSKTDCPCIWVAVIILIFIKR
jgi:hypothetical protein